VSDDSGKFVTQPNTVASCGGFTIVEVNTYMYTYMYIYIAQQLTML